MARRNVGETKTSSAHFIFSAMLGGLMWVEYEVSGQNGNV